MKLLRIVSRRCLPPRVNVSSEGLRPLLWNCRESRGPKALKLRSWRRAKDGTGRRIWCSLHSKAGNEGCNLEEGLPRRTNELARRSSGCSCSVISHGCAATRAAELLRAHAAGHDMEASLGLEAAASEVRCIKKASRKNILLILFILVSVFGSKMLFVTFVE